MIALRIAYWVQHSPISGGLLKSVRSLTHDPKEKAAIFPDVFDRKQNNGKFTMPPICFSETKLTGLAFCSRGVKNLINDLYANGGAGPDGISPLFWKTTDILSSKISVIFHNCVRTGAICTRWRFGNVTPLC